MVFPSNKAKSRLFGQSGKRKSIALDLSRKAMPPGYRKSKDGKWYLETRKNRSDKPGTRL